MSGPARAGSATAAPPVTPGAGRAFGDMDTCQGVSGGPLLNGGRPGRDHFPGRGPRPSRPPGVCSRPAASSDPVTARVTA